MVALIGTCHGHNEVMALSKQLLQISGVTKAFARNVALKEVSISVREGEIRALVGENGAGKSTLIKIVTGALRPDAGTVTFDGHLLSNHTPKDTRQLGIAAVHQELSLCPHLTVAENTFLGIEPKSRFGLIDYPLMIELTRELADYIGFGEINPREKVSNLALGQQQIVELMKALATKPRLLVLDEATSALTQEQTQKLFEILRAMRRDGLTVIMISHRLGEIFEMADNATVLKDGQTVGTVNLADTSTDMLVEMMAGREISDVYPSKPILDSIGDQPVLLSVQGLSCPDGRFKDVGFDLHKGEILGIGGLRGQGQKEVLAAIFGLRRYEGRVMLNGSTAVHGGPGDRLRQGIAYLPEDRKTQSVFLSQSIGFNISLPHLPKLTSRGGTVRLRHEYVFVSNEMAQLNIRADGPEMLVSNLSGGNQQKVALSKLISGKPTVYLLDEPTRGIDVATRREIYSLLRGLAEKGAGVIIVSSDTMELVGLCDRVTVMYEHRAVATFEGSQVSEANLVHASVVGGNRK